VRRRRSAPGQEGAGDSNERGDLKAHKPLKLSGQLLVNGIESPVNGIESPVNRFESPVDQFESSVYQFESAVDGFESPVERLEPMIHALLELREVLSQPTKRARVHLHHSLQVRNPPFPRPHRIASVSLPSSPAHFKCVSG
jgi:hypothetical protein